jgi:tagatose-6-phosphate ketose/aldose isomerase
MDNWEKLEYYIYESEEIYMILNFDEAELKERGGLCTLSEIQQQSIVFRKVLEIAKENSEAIALFFQKNKIDKANTRIIFTGAGTSEFVGNSIVHFFTRKGYDAHSIATTDIVQNIEDYILADKKTILVSFARSGNSPESVATYKMMSQFVKDIKHVVITCNAQGELAKCATNDEGNYLFILPPESNDAGFAMTSSFTGMMTAALLFFASLYPEEKMETAVQKLVDDMYPNMQKHNAVISGISHFDFSRIVYLGSGNLNGIAQESHLKMLELTAGKIAATFNTPMGFRHGPKSFLNDKTLVVIYLNKDEYRRQYDLDLLRELNAQKQAGKIVVLDYKEDAEVKKICDDYLVFTDTNIDVLTGIDYVSFAQLLAFNTSLNCKLTPDNPWPSGEVNRVVKGVIIHEKKC